MKIIIKGVPPYDGEYPFDLERLKNRDVEIIKRVSGYTPLEYMDAGKRGDPTLLVALGVCAARKGGLVLVNEEAFWEAEIGAITIDLEDDEAAASPPQSGEGTPTTPSGAPSPDAGEQNPAPNLRITGTDS